MIHTVDVRRLV